MNMILLLLAVFAASQALPNRQSLTETDPGGPTNPSTPPSMTDVCGARNTGNLNQFRIITGDEDGEAEFAEFPWMAVVLDGQDLSYRCGGSLVHPQVILTAAHKVRNSTDLLVRLGEWNTQTEEEPLQHQDKRVIKIVQHPDFDQGSLHYDFALLFLDSPVISAPNVGTICLPQSSDVFDGSQCFVAGWGKDTFGRKGVYRAILKKIKVPIVNHDTCQTNLRQTRLGNVFKLHSSFMCAGGEAEKDACIGDGGGPLMCHHPQDPNRFTQVGIVSWGIGCGSPNVPGVYSNVAYVREWIDQQLTANHVLLKN